MDQYKQDTSRKEKKKKHHRSRSRSQHKKRKHSRSRSERKKDKKKKDRSEHQLRRSSQRKSIEKDRESKFKDRQKQKIRNQSKQKQRDNDRKKDKHQRSDKYQRRDKEQKSKDRQKGDRRDKQGDQRRERRDRSHDRDRNGYKQRDDRRRDRQRQSKFDKYDRYDRYERDGKQKRQRQRQTFKSKQYEDQRRSRNRSSERRRDKSKKRSKSRQQRRNNRRRQNRFDTPRFRFDSPPKSDESDMSDDPQKMQKLNRMKAQKQLVTSKADRKLYLGNLPPNITSQQLMDMLNAALKKMEINTQPEGDSIISAWISPDGVGHYAFVQFRTAQQATNGLTLNGASLFGYQLKLGRPKQYIEYNKQLLSQYGTDSNIDTIIKKVFAMGGQVQYVIEEKIICPPSRVIILKHIVTVQQLAIDQQYQEILEDVKDMAKRFGDVQRVVIPRPHEVIDLQQVQKRVKGLGFIFIEYKTVEQAIFARKQFIQKQFSGRSVACGFFDETRFREGQYDPHEKVIIDF